MPIIVREYSGAKLIANGVLQYRSGKGMMRALSEDTSLDTYSSKHGTVPVAYRYILMLQLLLRLLSVWRRQCWPVETKSRNGILHLSRLVNKIAMKLEWTSTTLSTTRILTIHPFIRSERWSSYLRTFRKDGSLFSRANSSNIACVSERKKQAS
jgi:hypothetical protein